MKKRNLLQGELSRIVLLPAFFLMVACTTALVVTAHGPPPTEDQSKEQDASKQFGSIEGVVTFEGDVPQNRIANDAGHRHDLLTVDRKTRGLKYAIA